MSDCRVIEKRALSMSSWKGMSEERGFTSYAHQRPSKGSLCGIEHDSRDNGRQRNPDLRSDIVLRSSAKSGRNIHLPLEEYRRITNATKSQRGNLPCSEWRLINANKNGKANAPGVRFRRSRGIYFKRKVKVYILRHRYLSLSKKNILIGKTWKIR